MDALTFDFMMGTVAGLSKEEALDAAEAKTGDHCGAELWRNARTMALLFEQYNAATSAAAKRTIRRNINQQLEELYATDLLCDECMTWFRGRVLDMTPVRPRKDFNFKWELGVWYEVANKQIRKSGCAKCPWQKRANAQDSNR